MSSCRATSFYLAPGVVKYFKDHTVAAVLPDGQWAAIKHRGDIARLKQEHALWDGTVLCGPRYQDGLRGLHRNISTDGSLVEIWNVDERSIEGRRPTDAAVYALHKWAIAGDAQAVGGVRQLVETIAPGAPKSVRNAMREAVLRGEHHAVDVVAAAWRAELLRNPDQIVELLRTVRIPFRSVPEARLEQMLRAVVATGRSVDAQVLISKMIDGSQMLDAGTGQLLAQDTTTSSVVLGILALNGNYVTRQYVAQNPNTPVSILEQLSKDDDSLVRCDVAINPNTPVAILEQLSKDDDSRVRCDVARNPNTSVAILEQLSKDEYEYARASAAGNPNTPVSILEQLSKDDDSSVRCGVARNPNTPVAILELFSHYLNEDFIPDDVSVETSVAQNPNTPVPILEWLSGEGHEDIKYSVACHPNTPVGTLEELAEDRDAIVRCGVAGNPNTPAAVLEQLATSPRVADGLPERDGDRYGGVRRAVADNLSTPVAILEQLSKDEDAGVRGSAAKNPNTPVSILEQLSKDDEWYARRGVARNPNTPVAILEQLSKDEDAGVRGSAAKNPNTPVSILEQLSKDDDSRVRATVAQNQSTRVETLNGTTLTRRSGAHNDQYEYHAIVNGIPFELRTTSDLAYNALVQYGAPAADYPATISDVSELGRAGVPFWFPDDTLKLRHTLAESTVQINDTILTPRVVSSPRELTENSNYMGNCTSGYEEGIRRDQTLILALNDATSMTSTLYNVEILRGSDGRWDTIAEINSRFNEGVTDDEQRVLTERLTEILRSV